MVPRAIRDKGRGAMVWVLAAYIGIGAGFVIWSCERVYREVSGRNKPVDSLAFVIAAIVMMAIGPVVIANALFQSMRGRP